jgi:hypothetical protein
MVSYRGRHVRSEPSRRSLPRRLVRNGRLLAGGAVGIPISIATLLSGRIAVGIVVCFVSVGFLTVWYLDK